MVVDSKLEKWNRWIDGPIRSNVLTMHLHRDVWRRTSEIITENDELPASYWWEFMSDVYSNSQVIAVRRQVDLDPRVSSLAMLISEIKENPELVSKSLWLSHWEGDDDPGGRAMRGWESAYAGDVGDHLDPAIPHSDLARLDSAGEAVRKFANKHVAHSQAYAKAPTVTLTLKDVHDAIDVIGELFAKYYEMLTAGSYVQLVPQIQGGDWTAVFRQAWQREDKEPDKA